MLKRLMEKLKRKMALCMTGILILTSFTVPALAAGGYSYSDGDYTGTGAGRNGTLSATVTVSGSAVTAISVGENSETPDYLEKAKKVIDEIIEKQSTDVDTVSGATLSSRAIIEAVKGALDQAYTGIFDYGYGTAASPFIIATTEQLEGFRDSVNDGETYKDQYIALSHDIDIGETEWIPIDGFAGTFNGKGHVISGLAIGSPESSAEVTYAGLFGTLEASAVIKNLGLEEVAIYVSGDTMTYAGGLAGKTNNGTAARGTVIDNCYVTGTMIASETTSGVLSFAGGLVGNLGSYGSIANCRTDISVNSKAGGTSSAYAGGLISMTGGNTTVVNGYTLGDVTGTSANANMGAIVGGLFGMQGGKSYNCYTLSKVTANNVKADGSYQTTVNVPVGVLAGQVPGSGQMDTMYYAADTTVTINEAVQSPVPAVGRGTNNAEPTNLTGITGTEAVSESFAAAMNNGLKSVSIMVPDSISLYAWELSEGRVTLSSTVYVNPDIGSDIFAGGEGTKENPYLIRTEEQLRDFAASLNEKIDYAGVYIKLADNIDVSSRDWVPVGFGEYPFCGTFDGGGYQISGLRYGSKEAPKNADNYVYIGLFGVIGENGLVKNLGLEDVGLYTVGESSTNTAAIAGYLALGGIDNCYAVGSVAGKTTGAGNNFAGGLLGNQYKGYIINSWVDVDVRSEAAGQYVSEAGGLVSLNNRGLIANCYTLGDASGDAVRAAEGMAYVSNLVACQAGTMINCYVLGNVTADSYSYYVGAISGMTTGIGKGYLAYYNKEASQKIDSQIPDPFVAVGTTISMTEDGITSSGFNYGLAGFTLAEMKSGILAEVLNNNFKSFPVDLSQWLPADRTLKTWQYDTEQNLVVHTGTEASVTYVPVVIEDDTPVSYKAGTYYGRAGSNSEILVSVTVTKDKITSIDIISQSKEINLDSSAVLAAVLEAQSTRIDYDTENASVTGLLEAIETALKKAAVGDTSGYGRVNPDIFAGGTGKEEDPYRISNANELAAFAASMNEDEDYEGAYVVLTEDISLAGYNWIPAGGGNKAHAFCGIFDGRGHTVDAITIGSEVQPSDYQYAALFGYANHAVIKNVNLTGAVINNHYTGEGRAYAGLLVSAIETGTYIEGCSARGSLNNQAKNMSYTGGLAGYTSGTDGAESYVTNSYTDVDVTGITDTSWIYAGGISGLNNRTYIINCYTLGNVTGNSTNNMNKAAAGGIAGFQAGYVRNCYAMGNINSMPASTDVGGYAGRHTGIATTYYAYYNTDAILYSGNTHINPVQGVGIYAPSSATGLVTAEYVEGLNENIMKSEEFPALLNGNLTDSNVAGAMPQNIAIKSWVYDPALGLAVLEGTSGDNSDDDETPGRTTPGRNGSSTQNSSAETAAGGIALEGFDGKAGLTVAKANADGRIKAAVSLPADQILSRAEGLDAGDKLKITVPIASEELINSLKDKESREVNITVTLPDSIQNHKAVEINILLVKNLLETAGEEGKTVTALVADDSGRERYSWSFAGENLQKTNREFADVNLSLERRAIVVNKDTVNISQERAEDISVGLAASFSQDGVLPAQAKVKIYVGDLLGTYSSVKAGSRIYLYHRNDGTGKLETLPYCYQYSVDQDGYIAVDLIHCSDYIMLTEKAGNGLITSLLKQITVTPDKTTLYAGGTKDSAADISIKLPHTLELVKALKDPTLSSAIGGVTVTYQSNNKAVASVDSSGRITAKKAGTAKITATVTLYSGKSKKVAMAVTVKKPYLAFIDSADTLKAGDTTVYKVKGYGVDLNNLEWTTAKKGIVVIGKATGKAAAKSKGTDYVIAKAGNVSLQTKVVVK